MTKKAIIDYGHGGNDPGGSGNGLREKDLTLSIGKKISKILKDHGVRVVETRTSDKTVSLNSRTNLANREKADIFVSIHVNAFTSASAHGVETFNYPGSANGAKLAKSIQDELVKAKLFKNNRGTKTANFHVLRETSMPAALTELGFITNKDDVAVLKSKQDELALAVAKGILKYLGTTYIPKKQPSPTGSIYRVRKSANDAKSQIGAFKELINAKNQADKNKGYKVYSQDGKLIYDPAKKQATKPTAKPKKDVWDHYINGNVVKAYQRELNKQFNRRLAVDGLFGNDTISAGPNIRRGAKGDLTRILQERLAAKGFAPTGGIDGIFGAGTEQAVRQFQRYNKLTVDGIVGRETWKALFRR